MAAGRGNGDAAGGGVDRIREELTEAGGEI